VIRKLSVSLFTLVVLVSAMSIVSQAQSQALLTRHMRDAVANGEAKSVGHLPATKSMRFDVVLALRHQPELRDAHADLAIEELGDPARRQPAVPSGAVPEQGAGIGP